MKYNDKVVEVRLSPLYVSITARLLYLAWDIYIRAFNSAEDANNKL